MNKVGKLIEEYIGQDITEIKKLTLYLGLI